MGGKEFNSPAHAENLMFCTDSSCLESDLIQFNEELSRTFHYNDETLRNTKIVGRVEEYKCT